MYESKFSLRWETFKNNLSDGFTKLQQMQEFVDVTLAAGGHFVKVHQNILALASPYFKEMLKSINNLSPCQHPVIFLGPIDHEILCLILEYMYTGEVQVPSHLLPCFVEAAKMLHIVGIKDLPQNTENIQSFADDYLNSIRPKESTHIPSGVSNKYKANVQQLLAKKRRLPQSTIDLDSNKVPEKVPKNTVGNSRENVAVLETFHYDNQMSSQLMNPENDSVVSHDETSVQAAGSAGPNRPINVAASIMINNDNELNIQPLNTIDDNVLLEPDSSVQATENVRHSNIAASITINNDSEVRFQSLNLADVNTIVPSDSSVLPAVDIRPNDFAARLTIDNENYGVDVQPVMNIYLSNADQTNADQNDMPVLPNVAETNENLNFNQDCEMADDLSRKLIEQSEDSCDGEADIESGPLNVIRLPDASETKDVEVTITDLNIDPRVTAPLYIVSNRGSLQMILNRFVYNLHHTSHIQRKRRWRCVDYRRHRCPAFIDTDNEKITSRKFNHVHPFHDDKIIGLGQKKELYTSIDKITIAIKNNPRNRTSH